MSDQMDDLQTLLEQLKAATADNPPYKGFSDDEKALMDQIRAYGEAAIEPLIAFAAQLMAETEATAELDTGDDDLTYYFADAHIADILTELPLTEDHVRQLFELVQQYPDNDWYHTHLVLTLGKRGEVVIEPALEILRDRTIDYFLRNTAAEILGHVAKAFPDLRERIADQLVAIMSGVQRKQESDHDRVVNAFMLSALGETHQEQHIPFIKQMFKSRRVDEMATDLDWVLDSIQGIDPIARHGDYDPETILGMRQSLDLDDDPDLSDSRQQYSSELPESMTPFRAEKLPGRNDPCWCGSGKKYKHCHWREDQQKRGGK